MRCLRVAPLVVTLLLVGCARRTVSPTEALENAAANAGAGAKAPTLALAGFHALLMEGDAKKAATLFDDAVAKDPAEPLALTGEILMAQRVAVPQKALAAALDLIERSPNHPLAPVAARIVLDTTGLAKSTSTLVRERAPALLAKKQQADTAHLLRSALANAYLDSDDLARHAVVLSEMGVPTSGTLVGPFSPWHLLSTAEVTAPEKTGSLADLGTGPFGPLTARAVHFADGRISLAGEPPTGDVYLYAVDVTVPARGRFVLRTVTSMDHVALIDGTEVLSRLTSRRPATTLTTRVVKLDAGTHRLMLRMARENQAGNLTVALHTLDGAPSGLTFAPALGAAPAWGGVKVEDDGEGLFATADAVRGSLEDDYGGALARFLAARDAMGRDRDGARALLAGLPASVDGPAVAVLRADVFLQDRTVPTRVARGRATRELEAALVKDPGFVAAKMITAQLALDDGRQLDALEQARAARDAHSPPGSPVLQLIARVELALGLDAAAAATARDAEAALPGSCEALLLQYDIARRRDAIAEGDALLTRTSHCSGALARSAEHLRSRGELEGAIAQWESLLARDEGQVAVATSLSSLYVAQKRFDDAVKLLSGLRTQWPRNAQLPRTLGDVLEMAGRQPEALAAREAALALDGADLPLRRALARVEDRQGAARGLRHQHRGGAQVLRGRARQRRRHQQLRARRRGDPGVPRRHHGRPRAHHSEGARSAGRAGRGRGGDSPGRDGAHPAHHQARRPHARAREHRGQGRDVAARRAGRRSRRVRVPAGPPHARPRSARLHRLGLLLPGGAAAERALHLRGDRAQGQRHGGRRPQRAGAPGRRWRASSRCCATKSAACPRTSRRRSGRPRPTSGCPSSRWAQASAATRAW